ncbi:MAG: hypothetical protein ABR511_08085 [Acidimicrobiales bacterium]
MSRRDALLLKVAAGWTVFVWAVFLRNLFKDHTHTAGFKAIHTVIAVVSLAFAAVIWVVATRSRRSGHAGRSRSRDPERAGTR